MTSAALSHLEDILHFCESALKSRYTIQYSSLSATELWEIQTRLCSAIERIAPPGSVYQRNLEEIMSRKLAQAYQIELLVGVVRALTADVRGGYLTAVARLVRGEVFSDFVDMARHLLESGYKDAAAVIAGSVLEEHLRNLAASSGVAIETDGRPKKAILLNAELKKAGRFGPLEQKNITAWLDLRNRAAHGQYSEYSHEQVDLLILGISDFISRSEA